MKETLLPNETSNDENKSNVTTTTSVNNNNNRKFNSSASPRGRRLIVEIPIPYRRCWNCAKRPILPFVYY